MKIIDMEHKHFPALFQVVRETEPVFDLDRNTSDRLFSGREGFVLQANDGRIVGHITYDNYTPRLDATVHCGVIPEFQGRWLTKKIYKAVFDRLFIDLECARCSGFAIAGINDLTFHERLGFKLEGVCRNGFRLFDNYYDVWSFGMLKNERRW